MWPEPPVTPRSRPIGADVDVCVVGGGPAGAVFAIRMAQLGRRVCLVERRPFPRLQLGESLTPGVRPLLASIGAAWALDAAGAVPVQTVMRHWGASETARTDPRAAGCVIDRSRLDALLLAHARSQGVQVLQPASLRQQTHRDSGGWSLAVESAQGGTRHIASRVLAFATGRSGSGAPRVSVSAALPRTIALHAYWSGASLPREPRIESVQDGWCWGVPIPGVGYNALVFVDAAHEPGCTSGASLGALSSEV